MKKQILALLMAANILVGVSGCTNASDVQTEQKPSQGSATETTALPEETVVTIPPATEVPTVPTTEPQTTEAPTVPATEIPTESDTEPVITEAPTESTTEAQIVTEPETTEYEEAEETVATETVPAAIPAETEPEPTEVPETTQPAVDLDYAAAMAYGNAYAQNTYGALPGPDLNFHNAGYDPFARYRIEWIIEQGGQDYLNSQVAQNVDALYESLESSGGFAGAAINCDVHEAKYDHEEAGKVYIYIYYG